MNHPHHQGEVRPVATPDRRPDDHPVGVPLLRLRGRNRRAIPPDECLVEGCLICAWRVAGLIPPVTGD